MEALQLFNDFNYYRGYTNHVKQLQQTRKYIRELKPKPERLEALKEMHAFCTQNNIDSRLWLYMLFQSRKWMFSPKFNQLVPKSKKTLTKNIDRYNNLSEVPLFQKRVKDQVYQSDLESGKIFDKNRDLSATSEALKRRYLNEGYTERCMEEMVERTYGYHPRSLVCARCPDAGRCQQLIQSKVGFDIMALRRGEITVQQAQQVALRF